MPADYIAYDDGLITACEGALKQHWRRPNVAITRRPKGDRGTFYCHIDASRNGDVLWEEKTNATMPLPVLPIHPFSPANSFFFGIRLRFDHEFESTHSLTSASLYAFAGIDLVPIVRAEWDRRDIGKSQHAQPHWHLLGNREYVGPENAEVSVVEFVPRAQGTTIETERIHFPMHASWHLSASAASCQHRFAQRDDLLNWIAGLTNYLGEQFAYVVAKASLARKQSPAVEFDPSARS